jgi:ribonucleoside-diphosphate reductase alpha chain
LKSRKFVIEDSIAGWADAIKVLMKSYTQGSTKPIFDFAQIRAKGAKLITAGGQAPGPGPLKLCLTELQNILESSIGKKLTPIEVHQMACHIADTVLAGGIRRASLISFFDLNDVDMLTCKSGNWWELHPEFARCNNSETKSTIISEFDELAEELKILINEYNNKNEN